MFRLLWVLVPLSVLFSCPLQCYLDLCPMCSIWWSGWDLCNCLLVPFWKSLTCWIVSHPGLAAQGWAQHFRSHLLGPFSWAPPSLESLKYSPSGSLRSSFFIPWPEGGLPVCCPLSWPPLHLGPVCRRTGAKSPLSRVTSFWIHLLLFAFQSLQMAVSNIPSRFCSWIQWERAVCLCCIVSRTKTPKWFLRLIVDIPMVLMTIILLEFIFGKWFMYMLNIGELLLDCRVYFVPNKLISIILVAPTDEVCTLLQNFVLSTTESISEFILRRLTMKELSSVSMYWSNFSVFSSIFWVITDWQALY